MNHSLKICFICNEYPPMPANGIGIFVQSLAEQLVKLGVQVWVVGYGRKTPKAFIQNGVQVRWIYLPHPLYKSITVNGFPVSPASILKRFYLSLFVNHLVRTQKIDLVESHDFSGPLAIKPPCKLVVRLHGSVLVYRYGEGRPTQIAPLDRHYEIKQVRMADHLIAVSHQIGESTNQVMHFNRPYQVIYNGVDTDFFYPMPGIAKDKEILFVGNLMERKGSFDLIRAIPFVLERHPDTLLFVAGSAGGEHSQRLKVELEAVGPAVRDHIKLLGKVPREQLPLLYNQAAVFVFPSRVEAFGLTCAEAMACARPVVATSVASGPELVEDGISGLLVDPREPKQLADKICAILDDPGLGIKLGMAARQRVEARFSLKNLGLKNLDFYRSIIR